MRARHGAVLLSAIALLASPFQVIDAAERPFGPIFGVGVKDPEPDTATLFSFTIRQAVGEPFLTNAEISFPGLWQIDVGSLASGATIADVEVFGRIGEYRYLSQGPLKDHGSHSEPHQDPSARHWVAYLPDPSNEEAPPFEVDVWVTTELPDGHLRLSATLPESLVLMLEGFEASLDWLSITFRREVSLGGGGVQGSVFSTPLLPGAYEFQANLTGRDGSTVTRTAIAPIG